MTASAVAVGVGRRWRWMILRSIGTMLIVVIAGGYVSRLATSGDVGVVIGDITTRDAVRIGALTIVNLATYWMLLAAAIPGLGVARAATLQLPSTAISNVLPAGGAIGTGFTVVKLRRWGFTSSDIAGAMIVNGVLGLVGKVGAGVIAVVLLVPADGLRVGTPLVATMALLVVAVVAVAFLGTRWAPTVLGRALEMLLAPIARVAGRGAAASLS